MITYETLKSFCADQYDLQKSMVYACRREDGWWATDAHRIICVPMSEVQQGDMRFLCDEMPEDVGAYPRVENVVDVKGFTNKFTIEVSALVDALSKLPLTDEMKAKKQELEFVDCPECHGKGEIEIEDTIYYEGQSFDVYAEAECPICHGYGKIPDIDDYVPKEDDYDPKEENDYIVYEKTGKQIPDTKNSALHIPSTGYIDASYAKDLIRVAKEQGVDKIECQGGNYENVILFRMHGVVVGLMPMYVGSEKYKLTIIDVEI